MAKKFVLPDMEHSFHIEAVGKESKLNWVGDFKYRRPSIGQRGAIDVFRAKLNQDLATIDPTTNATHSALAWLRHTLISYPEWWKDADFGSSLYDENIVLEVYNKVMDFEAEWFKKVHGGDSDEVDADATDKKNPKPKRPAE